jgi:hypothetical protein
VISQVGGNLGVGTSSPAVALDIVGNNAGLRLSGTGTHQLTVTGLSSGRLGQDATGFFFSSDTNGKVVKFLTNNGTLNEWMRITSAGNVGIGTQSPAAKLDINGNQNIVGNLTAFGGTFQGLGGGVLGHDTTSSGNTVGVEGIADSTGGAGVVGNSTAAMGQAAGVRGFAASIGGAGVFGKATSATGVTAGVRGVASSPSGRGVSGDMVAATANTAITGGSGVAGTYGYNQDGSPNASATGGFGVFGQNTASSGTPQGVRGETTSPTGFVIGVSGFTHSTGGIGTDGLADATTGSTVGTRGLVNSPAGVGVNAINNATTGGTGMAGVSNATSGSSTGVYGQTSSPTGNGIYGVNNAGSPGGTGALGQANATNGTGVAGIATATTGFATGVYGQAASASATAALFNNTASGTILIGQAVGVTKFRLDGTGKGFFDGGTQTGGADFAEAVAVRGTRGKYEPGDLMVIDPAAGRRFMLSRHAYSTRVAGIYSTKPGMLATSHSMEESDALTAEVPLAVVGIVPCKVTTENGPIAPGDLLVTSSRPGHAMKGTDRVRMLGAVVGKALEPLQDGTGVIQVLVTLQ